MLLPSRQDFTHQRTSKIVRLLLIPAIIGEITFTFLLSLDRKSFMICLNSRPSPNGYIWIGSIHMHTLATREKKKQKERNEKMEVDLRYLVYLEKIPLILLWS
jgi:hypothetical protein